MNLDLEASNARNQAQRQPGTQAIPLRLDKFIIHLPNPNSGYNSKTRVENEVASLSIARDALQAKFPGFIPRVFGWGSARHGQGWILQEYMTGSPLLEDFGQMNDADKACILSQIADLLSNFQLIELPTSIRDYGGLGFGLSGEYVSAPMSIMDTGPFPTYKDLVHATIQSKLDKADTDPQVKGWRANGVRARLEQFIAEGLPVVIKSMGSFPKALVHADFSMYRSC